MRTHGRAATYSSGCRCDKCRAAWRDYQREYKSRSPQAIEDTRRRSRDAMRRLRARRRAEAAEGSGS